LLCLLYRRLASTNRKVIWPNTGCLKKKKKKRNIAVILDFSDGKI
jgi:hypothetical protein